MKILNTSLIVLSIALVFGCAGNSKKSVKQITKQESRPDKGHRPPPPRGADQHNPCEALKEGPMRSSEHGPMDNADINRDGTVLREELEAFMDQGEYRRVTILNFFDLFDTDKDGKLSDAEFAKVKPNHSFNGTDSNGDCVVTREEVIDYANQEGRSYRKVGLDKFFDLVDANSDNKATPEEIEAAHKSGLLARY
ncbi:MAG: hypothetical protein ABJN84_06375 [Flavobacteriaceae bacterium]